MNHEALNFAEHARRYWLDLSPDCEVPGFITYNRFIGIPGRIHNSIHTYSAAPFPADKFCPYSPWEDHVLIAHWGMDDAARKAGFSSADVYINHLITQAGLSTACCPACRRCDLGINN